MKADRPVIALEGVAKRYGAVEAVRGVSFALPPGCRVALVGHNGAG
jgi:Cu-processing system ATP-binding protein